MLLIAWIIDFKISSNVWEVRNRWQLFEELLNEFASYRVMQNISHHDLSKLIVTLLKPKEGDRLTLWVKEPDSFRKEYKIITYPTNTVFGQEGTEFGPFSNQHGHS